jgi:signal-transduction protein with cAMP-binding, CBS, and nucleotidyltransferase domain
MRAAVLDQSRKLFEQHGFFGQLSQSDLDAVLSHARLKHHRAGELIFAKGSPGRSMTAVLGGRPDRAKSALSVYAAGQRVVGD